MSARLGPRPLPLHLLSAAATSLSWPAGLLPWKQESPSSRAGPSFDAARAALEPAGDPELLGVIDAEARRRLRAFLDGITAYRAHHYRRDLLDPPCMWQAGSSRLLDYGRHGGSKRPVLVVPSLINRAYILDLSRERSLLRFLAGQTLRPFLLDWGSPGSDERRFTLDDYVAGRLAAALDAVTAAAGAPVVVLGYCMGGLLALALAQRRPDDIAGLACLATPWDFHAEAADQARLAAASIAALEPLLDTTEVLPVDVIQAMFAALDPTLVYRKFRGFAALDPMSPKARAFVAVEDWLNDGVPLAAAVARECLSGWYGQNTPARGEWRIAGEAVQPERLEVPALVVVPAQDRIVPPASALALADKLPRAERLQPALGHIGMIVGGTARRRVWAPLADWLVRVARRP